MPTLKRKEGKLFTFENLVRAAKPVQNGAFGGREGRGPTGLPTHPLGPSSREFSCPRPPTSDRAVVVPRDPTFSLEESRSPYARFLFLRLQHNLRRLLCSLTFPSKGSHGVPEGGKLSK